MAGTVEVLITLSLTASLHQRSIERVSMLICILLRMGNNTSITPDSEIGSRIFTRAYPVVMGR